MIFGTGRDDRRKALGFFFWSHIILIVLMMALGVRGLPLLLYAGYSVLMLFVLGLAHTSMLKAEQRAEDEMWWIMCLAGRQGASHLKIQSLGELTEAEEAYEEHKSFQNMKQLEHKKSWHDIVLRAYDRAIESIEKVESDEAKVLGKVQDV